MMSFKIGDLIGPQPHNATPKQMRRCVGKDKFVSAHTAREAAREHERQTGEKMKDYLCPDCGFYHIGHCPKRKC